MLHQLSEGNQAFLRQLSDNFSSGEDIRADLHRLVDRLPLNGSAMIIIKDPQTHQVIFDSWGPMDVLSAVYMVEGVKNAIYQQP